MSLSPSAAGIFPPSGGLEPEAAVRLSECFGLQLSFCLSDGSLGAWDRAYPEARLTIPILAACLRISTLIPAEVTEVARNR